MTFADLSFTLFDPAESYREPCVESLGDITWAMDFVPVIDVTNSGSAEATLLDISVDHLDTLPENYDELTVQFFADEARFHYWVTTHGLATSASVQQMRDPLFGNPPLHIPAGAVRSIPIRADVSARLPAGLSAAEARAQLRGQPGARYGTAGRLSIRWADGAGAQVEFPVPIYRGPLPAGSATPAAVLSACP